jgi:hypothetical protein
MRYAQHNDPFLLSRFYFISDTIQDQNIDRLSDQYLKCNQIRKSLFKSELWVTFLLERRILNEKIIFKSLLEGISLQNNNF